MLDQVLAAFQERCDLDLGVMAPGQTLPQLTARVITAMTAALERERPDLVLVHGDTTTAMATAVAAFYGRVAIGHVEAGLRSFDLARPWPEEFNRVAVDAVADLMFAPTESSAANLRSEYNRSGRIIVTGNTGIDALLGMAARLRDDAALRDQVTRALPHISPNKRLIVVTGHRRESFGPGFQRICDGLAAIAARPDVEIVYPVHLNPNVRAVVLDRLGGHANIHLIPPVGYPEMVYLMSAATILVTDSGGIQEEGPALGKPVLVMREVTERPEALETGVVKLVGTDPDLIRREVNHLLDDPAAYAAMARPVFPYGDGQAARRIADAIEEWSNR
jgi:UDP-N-acetylglucosamine 2-epimerase